MSPSTPVRSTEERKINVGCGATPTPGWINYDNSPSLLLARLPAWCCDLAARTLLSNEQRRFATFARRNRTLLRFADVSKRIPEATSSVSVVYSSHMIEHLDRSRAGKFLAEVRRVLVHGGIVRIVVPDLRKLIDAYLDSGSADAFLSSLHMSPPKVSLVERIRIALIGYRHHLWMYDAKSLAALLTESGFHEARAMLPGETRIPSPGGLDLSERADESICVEAIRPY